MAAVNEAASKRRLSFRGPAAPVPKQRVSLAQFDGVGPKALLYSYHGSAAELTKRYEDQSQQKKLAKGQGQGIVMGVILPSLQNIFGVILFLRLPWLVGLGGLVESLCVVFLGCLATGLTASSLSAIATNGKIGGGGNYYLISRSLGPALGASVGLCFFMANALGAAMYLIGTVEAFEMASPDTQLFPAGTTNNIRFTGLIILALALVLNFVGLKYVTKVSIVFLVVMLFSILCMYLGAFVGPFGPNSTPESYTTSVMDADGKKSDITLEWTGLSAATGRANAWASYDHEQLAYPQDKTRYNFFGLLSIWFPACTGFEAGSNRSADLQDPEKDLPRGTFFAHIVSSLVYCSFPIIFACLAPRETLLNDRFFASSATWPAPQILVYGVIASTIGAGLTSLISGSRLLAAIANDKVLPILNRFAVAPGQEPRKALACVGLICAAAICIGELNAVAPILTMFFLMCYTCVNMSCVLLHLLKDPNWRPAFRFTHWTLSAAGSVLCIFIMFAISWLYALIAIAFCALIFVYAGKNSTGDWGDGLQSLKFQVTKGMLYRMSRSTHVKNFRLNLLAVLPGQFCDCDNSSQSDNISMQLHGSGLLNLVAQLSQRSGVIWVTSILEPATRGKGVQEQEPSADSQPESKHRNDLNMLATLCQHDLLSKANAQLGAMLNSSGIRGFSQVLCTSNFQLSFLSAIQTAGLGPVKPNCTLVNYPANCLDSNPAGIGARSKLVCSIQSAVVCDTSLVVAMGEAWPSAADRLKGSIDIWWFAASFAGHGGMMLLLPQLLRWHPVWSRCTVRVFVVNDTNTVADTIMADTIEAYLKDVRIPAQVMTVPLVAGAAPPVAAGDVCDVVVEDGQADGPTRQVSFATHNAELFEKCVNHWIHLDTSGDEPCNSGIMDAAKALNSAFLLESTTAEVVLTNLPDLLDNQSALGYCQVLDQIAQGLKRVIFVQEDTRQIITQDN